MDYNNYEAYEVYDQQSIEFEESQTEKELPKLTTAQTERIRDGYPSIEHLEAGNVAPWLQERKEQLWEKAAELELGCNAAKSISLGVATIGSICYATSPFAPFGAAIAGISYIWTLFEDTNQTKKFAPIPFIKGNFIDFLNALGDAGLREEYFAAANNEAETLLHLPLSQQKEYLLLFEHFEKVTDYLEGTQPGKCFYAYRWLLGAFGKFHKLPTAQSMQQHLQQVAISTDLDYERVKSIYQRQSNTGLPSVKTQEKIDVPSSGSDEVDVYTGEVFKTKPQISPEPVSTVEDLAGEKVSSDESVGESHQSFNGNSPITSKSTVARGSNSTRKVPDLPSLLAKSLKISLIVGTPGSGKGIFVSNALDALKHNSQRPTTIFYLDPKNDPKEDGYFQGRVDDDKLFRLDAMTADAEEVYEWAINSLASYDAFDCGTGIKLIVFDELKLVMSILGNVKGAVGWLVTKLSAYSTSGESRGIVLWGISQSAHTRAGFDGSDRSIFVPVFIVDGRNISASEGLLACKMIPSDRRISSVEIKRLCEKSPVNRAIFYGGTNKWYPMPKLENFSGFDRDSRTFIGNNNPTKIQPENLYKEQIDKHIEDSSKADLSSRSQFNDIKAKKVSLENESYYDNAFETLLEIIKLSPN